MILFCHLRIDTAKRIEVAVFGSSVGTCSGIEETVDSMGRLAQVAIDAA
jgi:hypothetical protein